MNVSENLLLRLMILVVISFLAFIVFGDNGLIDLRTRQKQRNAMIAKNNDLIRENITLYRTIKRLDDTWTEGDSKYIESVARRELGVIGKNELIFEFTDKFTDMEQIGVNGERAEF